MTSQITTAELGRLRADSKHWLTETATLNRVTPAPDGKGGYTNSRAVIWTGKVGRRPINEQGEAAKDQGAGDMATEVTAWMFTFPAGVDVKPQDEIVASSRTYQVVGGIDKSVEIARYVVANETT